MLVEMYEDISARHRIYTKEYESIKVRMKEVDNERRTLKARRDKLKKLLAEPKIGERFSPRSDRYVTPGTLLCPVLKRHLEGETQASLSRRSGVTTRSIRRIAYSEVKWISLRTADRLLTAMGKSDLLLQDEWVIPNPLLNNGDTDEVSK